MIKPWDNEVLVCSTESAALHKAFIEAKAEHDFHYNQIHNGYKEDSNEYLYYKRKINKLALKELTSCE